MKVFLSSGGGVAIGESFGAEYTGEVQKAFYPLSFDYYGGTSAGAFDAFLTANGWKARQKIKLFTKTDFQKFFTPFGIPFSIRKLGVGLNMSIKLDKLADFYDSLTQDNEFGPPLKPLDNILINSVDTKENIHTIYCQKVPSFVDVSRIGEDVLSDKGRIRWIENAFTTLGIGQCIIDSQCLPGLQSSKRPWMRDGGFAQNPLISIFPYDADITMIDLGYAGKVEKNGKPFPIQLIDQVLFGLEFCQNEAKKDLDEKYTNLKVIYPSSFTCDRTNFGLSSLEKYQLVNDAAEKTGPQWRLFKTLL